MTIGMLLVTRSVHTRMDENLVFAAFIGKAFERYTSKDWGDICQEDKDLNDMALFTGDRIVASYEFDGEKIFIITEADRSCTTILFASEY